MRNYRYVKGEYKEDSTRGKAIMRPKTYKGDSLISIWLDRRKLAALSIWLDSNGLTTRFISDVVRNTLDQVYEKLLDSGAIEELDVTMAGDILRAKYKIDLNPQGRGERNLLHNLQLDEVKKEHTSQNIVSIPSQMEIMENYRKLEKEGKFKDQQTNKTEERVYPKDTSPIDPRSIVTPKVTESTECLPITNSPAKIKLTPEQYQQKRLAEQKARHEARKKSDVPRYKTDNELEADAERIAKKDHELATMDMSAPKNSPNQID